MSIVARNSAFIASMTILGLFCVLSLESKCTKPFYFSKYGPKTGGTASCLDGHQYAFPIGLFVFVVAVCIPVCSSHAHSVIVVDRE